MFNESCSFYFIKNSLCFILKRLTLNKNLKVKDERKNYSNYQRLH
jgi:hypothetical protein